ncbi:hypothetical protein D3C85_249380 [compost metagenome]
MMNIPTFLKLCAVVATVGAAAGATVSYFEKKERDRQVEIVKRNIKDLTTLCNDIVDVHGQKALSANQLANLLEIRRRVGCNFVNMKYHEIMALQSQIEVIYNVLNSARK